MVTNPLVGTGRIDGCAPIITRDAYDRAESLLREHLDERQANEWQGAGFFDLTVPSGNRYRVGRIGNTVKNLDTRTAYCLQPVGDVPKADTALAHKLWLEADEAGFLAAANHFPYPNEWERPTHVNCRGWMEEPQGELHLETLEEARSWAEARDWDITLTIIRPELPFYCGLGRERAGFLPRQETAYEVNDMASDAHTVDLLRQAAIERNNNAQS